MRQTQEVRIKKCIGKSKGRLSTKTHTLCDAVGHPTGFHLTPGQACDLEGTDALLPGMVHLADKAYDTRDEQVVTILANPDVEAVIPPKSHRKKPREYDIEL